MKYLCEKVCGSHTNVEGKFQPLHKMNKSEFEMSGDMKCVYSQFTLDLNQAMYFLSQ